MQLCGPPPSAPPGAGTLPEGSWLRVHVRGAAPCGASPASGTLPCSEFMVEEHELRKEKIQEDYNDKYWDQRYTVVQRHIPSFLQKMAGKVLSTGEHGWARPHRWAPQARAL